MAHTSNPIVRWVVFGVVALVTLACTGYAWLVYTGRRTYFRPLISEDGIVPESYSTAVQCGERLANGFLWPFVMLAMLNVIGWVGWFRLHRWPRR